MSNTNGQIHALMVEVMKDVASIEKNREGQTGSGGRASYKYRGIDDAVSKIGEACRRHCVITSSRATDLRIEQVPGSPGQRGEPAKMFVHVICIVHVAFHAPDGSFVEMSAVGQGSDSAGSDKAANKANSNGYKYAIFNGLCVPTKPGTRLDSDAQPPRKTKEAPALTLVVDKNDPKYFPSREELALLHEDELTQWKDKAVERWGINSVRAAAVTNELTRRMEGSA